MTIDQNTLRRLNKLWKDRHGHSTDTTAAELVEIRETISVGSSGAAVSPAYIHLTHNAGQTIAVAGEAISWDAQHPLIDPVGFADPADASTDNLPLTTVVVPYDGYYGVKIELKWASHTSGGTVEIRRTRNNNAVRLWPTADDPGIWTATDGQVFADIAVVPAIVGDELSVYVDHDAGATKDLSTAQVIFYKVESSAVIRSLYKAAVLASGPLAYWRLDETSGTNAADIAGHADGPFNGTYTNGVTLDAAAVMTDGSGNGSADFDGTDDHVAGSDDAELEFGGTVAFSVEAWINADTVGSNGNYFPICSKLDGINATTNNGWVFQNSSDGSKLNVGLQRWTTTTTQSAHAGYVMNASQTYHVVGTYDGTNILLYIDGVWVITTASGLTLPATTIPFLIGAQHDNGSVDTGAGNMSNGRVDEVAIYDRALDPDEILEHYNIGRGAFI